MKDLFLIGFILIIIGILLITISAFSEGKTKFAIFGFIGPIPYGFGNSQELLKIAIITTIVIVIIFLMFLKFSNLL
ncbi:MAG TPA: DUF131 domain-containing protein [Candidatus Aenigmarchaeota archaeon]|nr:DUF131 domain-containing protein [Candidatus Aenigmarchaeota archaeon]